MYKDCYKGGHLDPHILTTVGQNQNPNIFSMWMCPTSLNQESALLLFVRGCISWHNEAGINYLSKWPHRHLREHTTNSHYLLQIYKLKWNQIEELDYMKIMKQFVFYTERMYTGFGSVGFVHANLIQNTIYKKKKSKNIFWKKRVCWKLQK